MCCRSVEKGQHGRGRRKSQDWNRGGMQAPVHQATPSLPGGFCLPVSSSTLSRSVHCTFAEASAKTAIAFSMLWLLGQQSATRAVCADRLLLHYSCQGIHLLPCRHAANASRAKRVHTARGSSLTTGAAWTNVQRPGYSRSLSDIGEHELLRHCFLFKHTSVLLSESAVRHSPMARLSDFTLKSTAGAALPWGVAMLDLATLDVTYMAVWPWVVGCIPQGVL